MARSLGQLERLGAHVASVMDEEAGQRAQALETARRGFVEGEPSRRSARARLSISRRSPFANPCSFGQGAISDNAPSEQAQLSNL